ncbi:hypothetical protein [Leptolyngbya sp. FACHB-711]|uniref:hypothetical protein n=1 Tax=unclassified Leptolyngbya TaxID=2650499 RepID=UPI0019AA18B5|nr:hypothetical protein [Leptolyngbya sp. FACHB-711]MBD2023900.1 hypothetical protein [Leptolyngbya sp. FACHB-711]
MTQHNCFEGGSIAAMLLTKGFARGEPEQIEEFFTKLYRRRAFPHPFHKFSTGMMQFSTGLTWVFHRQQRCDRGLGNSCGLRSRQAFHKIFPGFCEEM